MSRFFEHTAAAIVAIVITVTAMNTIVTIPQQPAVALAATPVLA